MLSYYNLTPGTYAKVKRTIFKQFSRFRFDFLIQYECEDLILIREILVSGVYTIGFFFIFSKFSKSEKNPKTSHKN